MQTSYRSSFDNLGQASEYILKLLSEFISVNTLFIAVNDGNTNFILNAFNRSVSLVEAGTSLPLFETYCGLISCDAVDVLVIPSTKSSPLTAEMDVTRQIGDASFIGVPIMLRDKTVGGTICALDHEGYQFADKEVELLKTMATFLAYVADLESIAYRDDLTHAYNRNFINLYLTDRWKNKFETVAFFFMDIDNFKDMNDLYGHAAGDSILTETVQRIKRAIRSTDLVCRVGGDEFVAVVPNYYSIETLKRIVEDILQQFSSPMMVQEYGLQVSLSIGISLYPNDGNNVDELLQFADDAMYRVKRGGKRSFQLFSK